MERKVEMTFVPVNAPLTKKRKKRRALPVEAYPVLQEVLPIPQGIFRYPAGDDLHGKPLGFYIFSIVNLNDPREDMDIPGVNPLLTGHQYIDEESDIILTGDVVALDDPLMPEEAAEWTLADLRRMKIWPRRKSS
jgi:hypothetical protein